MTKQKTDPEVIEGEVAEEQPQPRARSKKNKELVPASETSVVAGLAISTDQLKTALKAQTEQRKLIADFIKKHLVKGVDFIRIHVVKNCAAEDKRRGSCKLDGHFSKDILAKPGQEKIFSLFQLTSELVKDVETMEMLQGERGLVAYKCLVKRGDQVVAEGRGACRVGDNRRDVNATIKIAEKRARMDACLALGFSEYFAQDLDDPDYQTQKKAAEEQAAAKADDGTGLPPRPKDKPIDDQERTVLAREIMKLGFDSRDEQLELLRVNGITEPRKMTSGQARELILKLRNNAFAAPALTGTVLDDIEDLDDQAMEEHAKKVTAASKVAELDQDPPLVVDDELKAMVQERAEALPLNGRGKMWLYKKVCGRPYSAWDKMKDEEWRRAYDLVELVNAGNYDIPDEYVAGVISSEPDYDPDATIEGKQASLINEEEIPNAKPTNKSKRTADLGAH